VKLLGFYTQGYRKVKSTFSKSRKLTKDSTDDIEWSPTENITVVQKTTIQPLVNKYRKMARKKTMSTKMSLLSNQQNISTLLRGLESKVVPIPFLTLDVVFRIA
jgi:hypothetical protein